MNHIFHGHICTRKIGAFGSVFLCFCYSLLCHFVYAIKWLRKLARALTKKIGKPRIRAEINLKLCFPDWTAEQRDKVIEDMFVTVAQVMLGIGEIAIRSKKTFTKTQ